MKYYITLFLLYLNFFSIYAQQNKKPFEFQLNIGFPSELANRDNPLPSSVQFNLRFQQHINKNFFFGFEVQHSKSNLKQDFIEIYQDKLYEDETTIQSSDFPIFSGIANFGYSKRNSKNNREAAVSVGIGAQKYFINQETLRAFSSGEARNVNSQLVTYLNPLVQLTLENTWYLNNFGFNIGIKTQYVKLKKPIVYEDSQLGESLASRRTNTVSNKKETFAITPTIGIRYVFNNPKDKTKSVPN